MKKLLHFSGLLLLSWCLSLAGLQQARASHLQGGQITYRHISGNTYELTATLYQDCSSFITTLPTSLAITARNTCAGGATVPATLLPVMGTLQTGQGYCPAIQALALCVPGNPYPNFQSQVYVGTINLPPAANWIIAYQECCRPRTANIVGEPDFRFEATLNNLITPVGGMPTPVNNTSPTFSTRDIPLPFVLVNQQTSINFTDVSGNIDGDSLVYSLDSPLANCGVVNTYKPRPTTQGPPPGFVCGVQPNSAPGTVCFLDCSAAGSTLFTPTNPLPTASGVVGTCGTTPGTAYTLTLRPNFNFNAQNGQVTFTPNVFVGGPAADGNDKYVVVGKVTEWRRLPGQGNRRYVVGSVRRDFLVIVINGAGNTVPTPPVVTVPDPLSGAVPINRADTTRITVQTCNYARVLVNFTDPDNLMMPRPNPLQNLTVTYTGGGTIGGTILQNGDIGTFALVNNGTPNPQMRFFFQPSSTFAGQVLRIPLQIADDACPVRGIQTRVIELRIVRGRTAQAVAASNQPNLLSSTTTPGQPTVAVICGGSLSLTGNVVRPDSIREVARNRTVAQTYGYRWEQVRGLPSLPANTTSQNLTVTPNGNSRYRLTITPLQGFGTDGGGCGDTTSILVKVAPRVTNSFDIPRIISSRNNGQNTLPGQTAVPPLTYELSNTTQVPPANSGFKLCNVTWTYQRVKDAQGNNTTDAPVVFSTNVQPTPNEFPVLTTGGQYEFRLTSAVVETATACAPNVRSCPAVAAVRTVEVPELKVPNIITPNGDNLNETFVVRPELQGGKLEIYNRWGRKVEEYSSYNNSWNAEGQPDGVYYYYLTDKGGVKTKGWIEVARNK